MILCHQYAYTMEIFFFKISTQTFFFFCKFQAHIIILYLAALVEYLT